MSDSIFSFIKSYIPSPQKDPKEDYLTQIFAWTLLNIDGFKESFCDHLTGLLKNPTFTITDMQDIEIKTQFAVDSGRIDMLIHSGSVGFIFEHKVDSLLSENQIEKYKKSIDALYGASFYTVLITSSQLQHTQDADIMLTWADIYDFLNTLWDDFQNQDLFMLQQLSLYLKQQGLGRMEPINDDNILGYLPGIELESKLDILFEGLMRKEWKKDCVYLDKFRNDTYAPVFNKKRWGRKGIDFFNHWKPGIFAGVLLNGSDHHLPPQNSSLGPDFVVFLEVVFKPKDERIVKMRNDIIHSKNFNQLKINLTQNHGDFEYLPGILESPWRVMVLRKPLFDILEGTTTKEEQVEKLYQTICSGINLITQDNLLGK